jgi:hypothetical protein
VPLSIGCLISNRVIVPWILVASNGLIRILSTNAFFPVRIDSLEEASNLFAVDW